MPGPAVCETVFPSTSMPLQPRSTTIPVLAMFWTRLPGPMVQLVLESTSTAI